MRVTGNYMLQKRAGSWPASGRIGMRRPSLGRHQTREWKFSRRRQVLRDLADRGSVEIVITEGDGRCVHLYVPAPDRKSRAEVVRHVDDALTFEADEDTEAEHERGSRRGDL